MSAAETLVESRYAWARLAAALALMTIGGSGMYAITVVLPRVQADFGVGRSDASLPYTFTMIGFGLGGILMGRLSDRYGVMVPVIIGALGLSAGFVAAGSAGSLWQFNLAQGLLIGLLGTSATFAPLVADISLWFTRRRGIAVAICISGNYLAGTVWPPLMQHFIDSAGWRQTYIGIGAFCLAAMLPLALVLRRRPPVPELPAAGSADRRRRLRRHARTLAGHAADAAVRGRRRLLRGHVHAAGAHRRLLRRSGLRPGARRANALAHARLRHRQPAHASAGSRTTSAACARCSSAPRCNASRCSCSCRSTGWCRSTWCRRCSACSRAASCPSYALIVREHFTPREAGARVGTVLMATLFGMALGGWMSGAIFDLHRLLSRRVRQRHRLEPAQHRDRGGAALPLAGARRAWPARPPPGSRAAQLGVPADLAGRLLGQLPGVAQHAEQRADRRIVLAREQVDEPERGLEAHVAPQAHFARGLFLQRQIFADQGQADAGYDQVRDHRLLVGLDHLGRLDAVLVEQRAHQLDGGC